MKNRIFVISAFVVLTFLLSSCGSKTSTNSNVTKTTASNSNTKAAKAPPKPTTKITSEKKPEGQTAKGVPEDKKIPVPEDWVYYADEVKGYGFWLPEGSVGDSTTSDNTDIFVAKTPPPSEVNVEVFAWKDQTLTKEELLKMTIDEMAEMGEMVTADELVGESPDYALAEATSVDSDGKKYKMKILVGTDVTDNYVMVVYTNEAKYEANKEILDMIWGNFEMYSGGASGTS